MGRAKDKTETDYFIEKLVAINRVSKTVKGGRRASFSALMVVGNGRGRVGFGMGKAKEVPEAIRKATESAKNSMVHIPLKEGRTLHHDVSGRFCSGCVMMRTAPTGTGVIAGGPARAVFEVLGVQDVVVKSVGSSTPSNMIRATMAGLLHISSPRLVASRRGKKVSELFGNYESKENLYDKENQNSTNC